MTFIQNNSTPVDVTGHVRHHRIRHQNDGCKAPYASRPIKYMDIKLRSESVKFLAPLTNDRFGHDDEGVLKTITTDSFDKL